MISFFRSIKDTIPHSTVTVEGFVAQVKSDRWRAPVQFIRECVANDDHDTARQSKLMLPAVTVAGTFAARNAGACKDRSGYVVIDLDHLEDPQDTRDGFADDPHVASAFVSPSGTGVKIIVRVGDGSHQDAYWSAVAYLTEKYGVLPDESGSDISRLCFASHDPQTMWKDADPLPVTHQQRPSAPAPADAMQKIPPNRRHEYLVRWAARSAGLGMTREQIIGGMIATVDAHMDLSDGRKFSRTELEDIATSAVAKYGKEDSIEGEMLGHDAATALLAGYRARQTERQRASLHYGMPEDIISGTTGLGTTWVEWLCKGPMPQPAFALGAVLATSSAIMGNRFAMHAGGKMNLYCFGVGKSTHGKEWARDACKRVLESMEMPERIHEGYKSGAGLLTALSESNGQAIGMLDEVGYLLEGMHAKNAPVHLREIGELLLQLYTAGGTFRGKRYADAKAAKIEIHRPALSLYCTTTEANLWGNLNAESLHGGLLGRCLFFFGERARPQRRREVEYEIPQALLDALQPFKVLSQAQSTALHQDTIGVDQDADDWLFAEQCKADDIGRNVPESDSPLMGRLRENALRVAAIRAWWRNTMAPCVTLEDAQWGMKVVRYCTEALEQRVAIKVHAGSPFARACEDVLTLCAESRGPVPVKTVLRRLRLPQRTIHEVIAHLVASEDLAVDEEGALTALAQGR